jgi:hypothetical protein
VHGTDLLAADGLGVLESESQHALGCFPGDKLDALDNTIDDDVLNARVLSLGVLTDQDGVDVVVRGLEANDGLAGSHVREKVKGSAESEVERDVALADGGLEVSVMSQQAGWFAYSEGALERNVVPRDAINGLVRDHRLAVLELGGDVDRFPFDRDLVAVSVACCKLQKTFPTLAAE